MPVRRAGLGPSGGLTGELAHALGRRSLLLSGAALGMSLGLGRLGWPGGWPGLAHGRAWLVDRWRGALIEVDSRLRTRRVQRLEAPQHLACGAGKLWTLEGPAERRPGQRLRAWGVAQDAARDRTLGVDIELEMHGVQGLWASAHGSAYVLEQRGLGEGSSLMEVQLNGTQRESERLGRGTQVSSDGSRLLCHDPSRGQWLAYHMGRRGLELSSTSMESSGFLSAVRAAGDGWWCLVQRPGPQLELRDAGLQLTWSRPLGFGARTLVPTGGGVLALGDKRLTRRHFDRDGRAGALLESGLRGPVRGAIALGEGCLLALPGALLALSPRAEVVCSQGGFGSITGLVACSLG